MTRIRSGRNAAGPFTPAAGIDWSHVIAIELWSVKHAASRQLDAPAKLNIEWMTGAGVRYAVVVVFEDNTWVWISVEANADDAVREVNRLAAEHDKPVRRGEMRCCRHGVTDSCSAGQANIFQPWRRHNS